MKLDGDFNKTGLSKCVQLWRECGDVSHISALFQREKGSSQSRYFQFQAASVRGGKEKPSGCFFSE